MFAHELKYYVIMRIMATVVIIKYTEYHNIYCKNILTISILI